MKLPKTQQELLDALKSGLIVRYMPYMGRFNNTAYYYRSDSHKRCTAAAEALLKKGLAEEYEKTWKGSKVRASLPAPPEQK